MAVCLSLARFSNGCPRPKPQDVLHPILHTDYRLAFGRKNLARLERQEASLLQRAHCLGIFGETLFSLQIPTESGRLAGDVNDLEITQGIPKIVKSC